jgi:transposase
MWTQAHRDLYKDDGRRYPSDLTDAQWALIAPLLSSYDPLKVDLREMVNACLYLEKTGCPWRYLPTESPFGKGDISTFQGYAEWQHVVNGLMARPWLGTKRTDRGTIAATRDIRVI